MNGKEKQVYRAKITAFKRYRLGKDFWISRANIETDPKDPESVTRKYYFITHDPVSKSNGAPFLIMHYNYETDKFKLYSDIMGLPLDLFNAFCNVINVERPYLKLNSYDEILDVGAARRDNYMFGKEMHFNEYAFYLFNHPYSYCLYPRYYGGDKYVYEGLDGKVHEKLKSYNLTIYDDELVYFSPGWGSVPYWAPNTLYRKIRNFRGKIIETKRVGISSNYCYGSWVLTTKAKYSSEQIPVKFSDLTIEKDNWNYWGNPDYMCNNIKIKKFLLEEEINLSETEWRREKLELHFHGKHFTKEEADELIKNGCDCERCKGFDIFYEHEGRAPYVYSSSIDYYIAIWAGHHGYYPDLVTLFWGCDCDLCKRWRKTETFQYYQQSVLKGQIYKIFDNDKLKKSYLFLGKNVEIKYTLLDLPKNEAKIWENLDMFPIDWHYSHLFTNSNYLNRMLHTESTRMAIALIHARLNNLPFGEALVEAERWLNEVWETQLNPECNCPLCRELKETEDMHLSIFQELMIEPIDIRVYPTGIMSVHFHRNYWSRNASSNAEWGKSHFLKYFNDYILKGKFCQCENCKSHIDKIKMEQYIPPEELKAPMCPICNRPVHNRDLIYESGEIAKKIIEQGKDQLLGVKAALCCSCYNKYVTQHKHRMDLCNAPAGSLINYTKDGRSKRAVMKINEETEEKFIGDIPLSEFLNTITDFQIRLPEPIEDS